MSSYWRRASSEFTKDTGNLDKFHNCVDVGFCIKEGLNRKGRPLERWGEYRLSATAKFVTVK